MEAWLSRIISQIGGSLPLAFGAALIGGLISAFSPCVLATVPLIVGYVGGVAGKDRRRAFQYSLTFCLGLVITFTVLGALAAYLGRLLTGLGRAWYLLLAAIMFFAALQLLGIIKNDLSCRLPKARKGMAGAFLLGLLAGVISSPCATPVLAAILAIVAGKANVILGAALLAVYAVGHCTLLLAAGASVGFVQQMASSPQTERIGRVLKGLLGVLAFLVGLYLVYIGI